MICVRSLTNHYSICINDLGKSMNKIGVLHENAGTPRTFWRKLISLMSMWVGYTCPIAIIYLLFVALQAGLIMILVTRPSGEIIFIVINIISFNAF